MKAEGNAAWDALADDGDDEIPSSGWPAYIANWRDDHRGRGLCLDCNSPVVPGKAYCEPHRQARNERCRRYMQRKRAVGLA
jgi:hypothetical protein